MVVISDDVLAGQQYGRRVCRRGLSRRAASSNISKTIQAPRRRSFHPLLWPQIVDPAGTYSLAGASAPTTDPAGTYSSAGASAPTQDPAGTFSPAGASAPMLAAAGTYIPGAGATSSAAELVDPAGTYSGAGASGPRRRTRDLFPRRSDLRCGGDRCLPAPTAAPAQARLLLRSPGIMSRRPAPAARRRTIPAITRRMRARRRRSWRCRRSYRARKRGSPRLLGRLTRRLLPPRLPIQTSTLQTVFRSS